MEYLKPVIPPPPKSPPAIVEILRGFLDSAFNRKITYLEITAVIDGKIQSISITTQPE